LRFAGDFPNVAASSFVKPPSKAIVLVDDEKSYVDLLANMLTENLGCPVISFTRPLDALAALPGLNVGVVVTDYHMPQMDGFEFIRAATPLVPGIPFIVITGHSHLIDHIIEPDSPLRSVLAKPFGWRTLAKEIALYAPEFVVPPPSPFDTNAFPR
jgi:Response regulator containing CheY-like receiver, AAA-type ATPase, and DNA-binding domains